MSDYRDAAGDEAPVAEAVDVPEESATTEGGTAGDGTSPVDPAEAVTQPRRFYANLADL